MVGLSRAPEWRPSRDVPFVILCVAIVLGMLRAPLQSAVDVSFLGTDVSLVATDFAFAILGVAIVGRLLGKAKLPAPARALTLSAAAFAAWLLVSSAINGAEPLVGAGKLLEYGLVALGAVLFVQHRWQLWGLIALIAGITLFAVGQALWDSDFELGYRLNSFMGSHEFAAIGTLSLAYGVASTRDGGRAAGCRGSRSPRAQGRPSSARRWPVSWGCGWRSRRSSRLPSSAALSAGGRSLRRSPSRWR
jgi:hypothetical protein